MNLSKFLKSIAVLNIVLMVLIPVALAENSLTSGAEATTTFSNSTPTINLGNTVIAPVINGNGTITYFITQADLADAGSVTNNDYTEQNNIDATEQNNIDQNNVITILKSASSSTDNTVVGDVVTYNYIITNTGNATLGGLKVIDNGTTAVNLESTVLAPSESVTNTATHTVTQADLDAASGISNHSKTSASETSTSSEKSKSSKFRLAPSVSLTSTKNVVEATEPAILTLSMVNPAINDVNLQVDVILKASSGMYVTGSSFVSSGSSQSVGQFTVKPGEEKHVTIQVMSTDLGEKTIESQVTYYPGKNKNDFRMLQQTLPIVVNEKSQNISTNANSDGSDKNRLSLNVPGFPFMAGFIGLICAVLVLNRRK